MEDRIKIKSMAKRLLEENYLKAIMPILATLMWIAIFVVAFIVFGFLPAVLSVILDIALVVFAIFVFTNLNLKTINNYLDLIRGGKGIRFVEYLKFWSSGRCIFVAWYSGLVSYCMSLAGVFLFGYIMQLFVMTGHCIVDNPKAKARKIIDSSIELTKNNVIDLLMLSVTFIGWTLLQIITFGLASFWVTPYKGLVLAMYYEKYLEKQKSEEKTKQFISNLSEKAVEEEKSEEEKSEDEKLQLSDKAIEDIKTGDDYLNVLSLVVAKYEKANLDIKNTYVFNVDIQQKIDLNNLDESYANMQGIYDGLDEFDCTQAVDSNKSKLNDVKVVIADYKEVLDCLIKMPNIESFFEQEKADKLKKLLELIEKDINLKVGALELETMQVKKSFFSSLFGLRTKKLNKNIKYAKNIEKTGKYREKCEKQIPVEKKFSRITQIITASVLGVVVLVSVLCGVLITPKSKDGIYYYKTKNGYEVNHCAKNISGDVVILNEYKGLPVTSIGGEAFRGCSKLTSITIPNSVTNIGGRAFSGCSKLTSITISDSVTSIGYSAFEGCIGLTSITIPDSVTSIGNYAFDNCRSLTSITISDSVTSIGRGTFFWCDSITSITIPNSVTSIGEDAFYGCKSLTSITIGNSVTSIGYEAFWICDSLKEVYYKGTKAEWSAISIDELNYFLTDDATRYYYSETQPSEGGNYWHYVYGVVTKWQ